MKIFQAIINRGHINTMIGECYLEPMVLFFKAENEADVVVHLLREYPVRGLKDITINYICLDESIKTINFK